VKRYLDRTSIFFSIRRRHTRFSRDWSSDVCSSDLVRCFVKNSHGKHTVTCPQSEADLGVVEVISRIAGRSGSQHLFRTVLAGATLCLAAAMVQGPAAAQSPLEALRQFNQRAEWEDRFDATMAGLEAIKSRSPTLSPETATHLEQAIQQYSWLVSQGGWPVVTSGKQAMKIGMRDPNVVTLRRRLMASGD